MAGLVSFFTCATVLEFNSVLEHRKFANKYAASFSRTDTLLSEFTSNGIK